MNATEVPQAHTFDPATGNCTRCGIAQHEVHSMLQRLASYQLLDATLQQRTQSKTWEISTATQDLYARLERARVCDGAGVRGVPVLPTPARGIDS